MIKHYITVFLILLFAYLFYQWGSFQYQEGVQDTETAMLVKLSEKQIEVDNLRKESEIERSKTESIIADVRADNDSLRQRAKAISKRASTTCAPAKVASTGWELFIEASDEAAKLAAEADRQRNDLAEWQRYYEVIK